MVTTVTMYQADDGTVFATELGALVHEISRLLLHEGKMNEASALGLANVLAKSEDLREGLGTALAKLHRILPTGGPDAE